LQNDKTNGMEPRSINVVSRILIHPRPFVPYSH
jgi:hypothetical protein